MNSFSSTSLDGKRVGYAVDPRFLDHRNPQGHPECPERLESIMAMLDQLEERDRLEQVSGKMVPLDLVTQVHSDVLVQALSESMGQPYTRFDSDTYACSDSFEVARLATGHGVELTRRVLAGTLAAGFALIRPPGHHAETNRIMGFCLLNNVALAAQSALDLGVERVMIVDWDVHHGNGTQAIFYNDPRVGYFSVHRWPFYPGTGRIQETGSGAGLGTTLNLPTEFGTSREQYMDSFQSQLERFAKKIRPQLILISAGFDSHRQDPIGSLGLETEDFSRLTRIVLELARSYCEGRVVSVLEGGYNTKVLAESVGLHLAEMLGQ